MRTPSDPGLEPRLQELRELLEAEACSCVIRRGDTIRVFRERGVRDLYRLYTTEPDLLRGASVADKVVGKGAAALMILGGVRELYAGVISRAALDLLERAGVAAAFAERVPRIVNRAGTGPCPLESRCEGAATAAECLPLIEAFVATLPR